MSSSARRAVVGGRVLPEVAEISGGSALYVSVLVPSVEIEDRIDHADVFPLHQHT